MFNNNNQPGFRGYNNNLLAGHQQYSQNNVPFQNNQLLTNNPNFSSSTNNHMFQQRLYMAKMDQINRAKRVDNMNIGENDLLNYVICPIKVEKAEKGEIDRDTVDRERGYIVEYDNAKGSDKYLNKKEKKNYSITKHDKTKKYKGNTMLREWWGNRSNQPYKNILKKENYKKKFKNKDDLIIHKVTDEDKIGLMDEFDKLEQILKEHDSQLDIIYSKSERLKHKKKFQYNNVYKYRLRHNTKDFGELKDFYKKEQKKIDREEKRIDNMVNKLMDSDILDDIEKEALQSQLNNMEQKTLKNGSMNTAIDSQLKKLKKELGGDDYDNIMKEIEKDDKKSRKKEKKEKKEKKHKSDSDNNKTITVKKIRKSSSSEDKTTLKIKKKHASNEKDKSIKISVNKTKQTSNDESNTKVGKIDQNTMDKYKNRRGVIDKSTMDKYNNRKKKASS